uniref:Uncharacterized protein n=1 Tax=Globodera rostochiensis TaxID=31243 RepID=A0A914H8G6_GLORO
MFQLLRFHLPLQGIACAVMMAPMLANANNDNASASAAFVEKSNFFSRLFAEIIPASALKRILDPTGISSLAQLGLGMLWAKNAELGFGVNPICFRPSCIGRSECDTFEAEKCTCGRHKCRPTQAFSAGTCCIAGYVSECCDQLVSLFLSPCLHIGGQRLPWGTCVLNTGQAGDDCCNAHHSWAMLRRSGGFRTFPCRCDEMVPLPLAQDSMFRVYGSAVSQELGWAKKCIIAFVVLFDLLMQRNIIF